MRDDSVFQTLKSNAMNSQNFRGILRQHHYDIATIIRILDSLLVGGLLWVVTYIFDVQWDGHYNVASALTTIQ